MKKSKLESNDNRRWLKQYGKARANLEYPNNSMVDALMDVARKYPEYYAYEYFGNKVTYREFMKQIENVAKALKNYGVAKDDRVTICMPSTPEAICMVYAVNLIGAVSSMIHPLSSEKEIEDYINKAESKFMLTMDISLDKVLNIKRHTKLQKIIVANAASSMPPLMHYLYKVTNYKKNIKVPKDDEDVVLWSHFISTAPNFVGVCHEPRVGSDLAVILYSGGTTGTPKGIMLSNLNFNALALGAHEMIEQTIPGNSVLSILPIFHGFGLAVCIHTPLLCGMKCNLIPKFNAKQFGDLIKKNKPNFLVGVPTLYESLLKQKLGKNDLECVEAVICGGDVLSPELKKKVDAYLEEHGSYAKIRPGYGLTEATAATCLANEFVYEEGSIGIPFPDNYFKIIKNDSHEEAKTYEDGEICISGPSVMMGYLNNDLETNQTLRYHGDRLWLHTGDIGCMTGDGTIIFKQRLKRIIISSGYNIYPSYIENVILSHPKVLACTVIGIPHQYRGQVAKAYIVLKEGMEETSELRKEIIDLCKKNVSKYALPVEYEYRESLPKTLVGKVAFTELEKENIHEKEK